MIVHLLLLMLVIILKPCERKGFVFCRIPANMTFGHHADSALSIMKEVNFGSSVLRASLFFGLHPAILLILCFSETATAN